MTAFIDWILSHQNEIVPINTGKVEIGSRAFLMRYYQKGNVLCPLNVFISSEGADQRENDRATNIHFSISKESELPLTIRRLAKSPVYISCFQNRDIQFYLIDLYDWKHYKAIIRIVITHPETNNSSQLTPLKKVNTNQNKSFRIGNTFLAGHINKQRDYSNHVCDVALEPGHSEDGVIAVALSPRSLKKFDSRPHSLLDLMNDLVNSGRKYHILRYIKLQNQVSERLIDELWFRQKFITPSLDTDLADDQKTAHINVYNYCAIKLFADITAISLSRKVDCRKEKLLSTADIFHSFDQKLQTVLESYFSTNHDDEKIFNLLQDWWDIAALPVYEQRFQINLKSNPFLFLIIYLTCLRYALPWSKVLLKRCNYFYDWPLLALIAAIQKEIIIQTFTNPQGISFYPGAFEKGNQKKISRQDNVYGYTLYSQKTYTCWQSAKKTVFKIDKKVALTYYPGLKKINVLPAVSPLNKKAMNFNLLKISTDNFLLQVPLCWKKAEFNLEDLHFRWIFKKVRFQVTIHHKKTAGKIEINDQSLRYEKSAKIKYYVPANPMSYQAGITLSNSEGQTYFYSQKEPDITGQVSGWIQNKYGIFAENIGLNVFNRRFGSMRSLSGMIDLLFTIPNHTHELSVRTKYFKQKLRIKKMQNPLITRLISLSPKQSPLIFILTDELQTNRAEIKNVLHKELGYYPLLLNCAEVNHKLNCKNLIVLYTEQHQRQKELENRLKAATAIWIHYNQSETGLLDHYIMENLPFEHK